MVKINGKWLPIRRYYRALESVSIASALSTALTVARITYTVLVETLNSAQSIKSTALTIYPCQIRVHQR